MEPTDHHKLFVIGEVLSRMVENIHLSVSIPVSTNPVQEMRALKSILHQLTSQRRINLTSQIYD
jgi:hypothetical protein